MSRRALPQLAVISAAILWSLDGLLRQMLYNVPAFLIISIEHVIGAVIFIPFLIKGWQEILKLGQRAWISVLWISICGGMLGTFFYTSALSYVNYINLSVVVLLQKLQPIFAITLAAVILKEPLSKKFLVLAVTAILGSFLVTFGLQPIANWNDKMIIAALLALLAAFSWGSSTVLGKHALKHISFQLITSLRLTITALVCMAVIVASNDIKIVTELTIMQWKILLVITCSTGGVALFIYYYGLNGLPASHATLYELFWPFSAMCIDWFYRERSLEPAQLFGAVLLLSSMIYLSKDN